MDVPPRSARANAARERRVHRDGLPLIRPEIALLYKSKGARERDSADFIQVLPALDANARRWLANALRAAGTGNEWLARLE